MKVLGIDIGGSAVKGAPVDTSTGRLIGERFRVETPRQITPLKVARTIAQITAHFNWHGPIGVGYPGVVRSGFSLTAANMHPRFVGLDTGALIAKETRCRVALVNDADAAGLAEMRFGAGKRCKGTVLLLTLGTGVGTALFWNGALFPNSELGHFPIKGRSAERYISSAARKRRDVSWEQWGRELGDYVRTLERILWPDLIIIGGGVSAKSEKFIKYVKTRAPLVTARFQNEAGIVGAALWGASQK